MNNGPEILRKQNEDKIIDKLLAQKRLYSKAKIQQRFLIIVTVGIPIIISLALFFLKYKIDEANWIYVVYLLFGFLAEKILSSVIQKNKKRAASIQEKIDIGLFGIPENKMINPDFIDYDIVRRYSKKNRKDKDKLRKVTNWYSEKIYELHTNIAILFCQRMNICYDQNIKHRYNNLLLILSGFTFAVLLTLSIINDFSIINFIIQVLLPLIPIANFTYSEIARNKEAVDNLQNLREIIEEEIDAVSINDSISATKLRNIQDQIYNNRVLSPLIPDCIYNHLWTSSEDEMNYSVQARIEELINNSNKDPDIK